MLDDQNPWRAESGGGREECGNWTSRDEAGTHPPLIRERGFERSPALFQGKDLQMACGRHACTILISFGFVTDSIRQSVHERVGKCRSWIAVLHYRFSPLESSGDFEVGIITWYPLLLYLHCFSMLNQSIFKLKLSLYLSMLTLFNNINVY